MIDLAAQVRAAEERLRPWVRETPVEPSPLLARASGAEVLLKLENLQLTGSFKLRGAMNKLLTLGAEGRRRGVVAASTGNHGAAVAHGARELGCPAVVFVPEENDPSKIEAIRARGAEIRPCAGDPVEAEKAARHWAGEHGLPFVSPYNDPAVVAGQGTVGAELGRQAERLDALLVALGGGGLLAGVAGYLKTLWPELEVVACSPESSAVMMASLEAGEIVEVASRPTLSDGTAGGVEAGSITFEPCRRLVDRAVRVSEEEIAAALRRVIEAHHILIEGAAAVPVAAYLREAERYRGRRVGIVLCGANIGLDALRRVLVYPTAIS